MRSFPSNLTAMLFGYKVKPASTIDNEQAVATCPAADFLQARADAEQVTK